MKKLRNDLPKGNGYTLEHFSDIHIHTGPDVKPRLLTDVEAAFDAKKEMMHSITIKCHCEPTSGRARIASLVTRFPVFGGVVLNEEVGGINPKVVETSARLGGKFIWFPTVSYSTLEIDWGSVEDVLHIVKEYNMVVATGHLKPDEIFKVIDLAHSMGIWRIVVNHPLTGVVGANVDEQIEMSRKAYLEHCFVACMEKHDGLDPKIISESIKRIGADRCIMATDFGQKHNQSPVMGMKMFIKAMIDNGISYSDVNTMCVKNPQKIIY